MSCCITAHRVYNNSIRQKQPFSNYVNFTSRRSTLGHLRRSSRKLPISRRRETNRNRKSKIRGYVSIMFNKDLTPMYGGRVLMNQSAMKDPVIAAVLKDMQARNWEPLPTPLPGVWNISDRD